MSLLCDNDGGKQTEGLLPVQTTSPPRRRGGSAHETRWGAQLLEQVSLVALVGTECAAPVADHQPIPGMEPAAGPEQGDEHEGLRLGSAHGTLKVRLLEGMVGIVYDLLRLIGTWVEGRISRERAPQPVANASQVEVPLQLTRVGKQTGVFF